MESTGTHQQPAQQWYVIYHITFSFPIWQYHTASIYSTRLKYLFWLTISNFVFPVIFSIALIIFNFRDQNFLHGGYVYISNTYIQIICGLLATVWSGTHKWVESRDDGNSKATATTSTGVINVELRDLDSRPSGSFGRSLNVPIWKKEEGKPLYWYIAI